MFFLWFVLFLLAAAGKSMGVRWPAVVWLVYTLIFPIGWTVVVFWVGRHQKGKPAHSKPHGDCPASPETNPNDVNKHTGV